MMHTITVRGIPTELHAALKIRASRNNRSMAEEVRWLLFHGLADSGDLGLGSALAVFGKLYGGIELDIRRDRTPAGNIDFGDE